MKKLIGILSVVLFSVVSVFAAEWRSAIYDNVVNDISIVGNKIYTATNGGIEVFSKDGTNLPGESLPWQIQTTVSNNLPANDVYSIAVRPDGYIFAMGYNWLSWLPTEYKSWQDRMVKKTPDRSSIGYDLAITQKGVYAALTDGLYLNGGGMWEKIPLTHDVYRIAAGNDGTIWGTWSQGIFYLDTAGHETFWKVGDQLIAGSPLNISVWGDTVVASGETGIYVFLSGTASSFTVIAYDPAMPQNNAGAVAYFKGRYYVGQRDGDLWYCSINPFSGWKQSMPSSENESLTPSELEAFGGLINCLATDGEKLYVGTNNKMWVYDGANFSQMSVTGIHYPHDNNITLINTANTGRILVGGASDGYRYDVGSDAPSLNSSAENIYGAVNTSFVDKNGALWLGKNDHIEKGDSAFGIGIIDGPLNHPYWLVGDSGKNVWLVCAVPVLIASYAGSGSWANKMDFPSQLAKEKILSVSSTGKRLWIGTDSSLYSYDFHGNWTYKKLQYSATRQVAGDIMVDGAVWVADAGYQDGKSDVKYINVNSSFTTSSWPYADRKINSIYVDLHTTVWVCTDSGVYYKDPINLWQAVPLRTSVGHTIADDYAHCVYVDSATNAVWFGTAGGLTVWHRSNLTSVKPALKPAMKTPLQKFSAQNVISYDIMGRRIANANRVACGLSIVRLSNGTMAKNMNLNTNRLR
ncbi:MAG: hypothetical protein PHO56_01115 [Patescibacteria group bacterium]|nr:hypothetical protein [Patescibacteria group bacterium]